MDKSKRQPIPFYRFNLIPDREEYRSTYKWQSAKIARRMREYLETQDPKIPGDTFHST